MRTNLSALLLLLVLASPCTAQNEADIKRTPYADSKVKTKEKSPDIGIGYTATSASNNGPDHSGVQVAFHFKPAWLLPKGGGDNFPLYGFNTAVGYNGGRGNWEFEMSVGIQHAFGSKNHLDINMTTFTWDGTFGYRIGFSNSTIAFAPFVGLGYENLLMGKMKSGGKSLNMRDVDDMGNGNTYSGALFPEGGLRMYFGSHVFASLRYAHSIVNYASGVRYRFVGIGIGYVR